MKKIYLLILIGTTSLSVLGQEKDVTSFYNYGLKHDFSVCYGIGTANLMVDEMSDMMTGLFTSIFTFGFADYEVRNRKTTHGIFVCYKNSVRPRLNIGIALGYEKLSKDVYMNNDLEFHKESKYYTLATELEFRYTNRDKIQLYSGFGLGLTCQADNQDNKSAPDKSETMCRTTGQLILFGLRGGSEFSPFFEFGCGYKGIINFGLSYQF